MPSTVLGSLNVPLHALCLLNLTWFPASAEFRCRLIGRRNTFQIFSAHPVLEQDHELTVVKVYACTVQHLNFTFPNPWICPATMPNVLLNHSSSFWYPNLVNIRNLNWHLCFDVNWTTDLLKSGGYGVGREDIVTEVRKAESQGIMRSLKER